MASTLAGFPQSTTASTAVTIAIGAAGGRRRWLHGGMR
jgi:hypothetical protein